MKTLGKLFYVSLTGEEFRLLGYFLRREGPIVDCKQTFRIFIPDMTEHGF